MFPGIGEEDFMDLMKESPAGMFDKKRLWGEYKKITDAHAMFAIHIKAQKIIITLSNVTKF